MPKVTYLKSAADPYDRMKVLLAGKRDVLGLTNSEVGSRVGQTHPTVKSRITNPERMTLEEMRRYAKALGISKEEICAALPSW